MNVKPWETGQTILYKHVLETNSENMFTEHFRNLIHYIKYHRQVGVRSKIQESKMEFDWPVIFNLKY